MGSTEEFWAADHYRNVLRNRLRLLFRVTSIQDHALHIGLVQFEKVSQRQGLDRNAFPLVIFENDAFGSVAVTREVHHLWVRIEQTSTQVANADSKFAVESDSLPLRGALKPLLDIPSLSLQLKSTRVERISCQKEDLLSGVKLLFPSTTTKIPG